MSRPRRTTSLCGLDIRTIEATSSSSSRVALLEWKDAPSSPAGEELRTPDRPSLVKEPVTVVSGGDTVQCMQAHSVVVGRGL